MTKTQDKNEMHMWNLADAAIEGYSRVKRNNVKSMCLRFEFCHLSLLDDELMFFNINVNEIIAEE